MSTRRWSVRAEQILRQNGWYEGRDVGERVNEWREKLERPNDFVMFERAANILTEFGGLRIEQAGPGKDFYRTSFAFDPLAALGEADRFSSFGEEIGARLFPVGEMAGINAYLAAAEDGRIFVLMDHIELVGSSIDEAIDLLIEGKKPQ